MDPNYQVIEKNFANPTLKLTSGNTDEIIAGVVKKSVHVNLFFDSMLGLGDTTIHIPENGSCVTYETNTETKSDFTTDVACMYKTYPDLLETYVYRDFSGIGYEG